MTSCPTALHRALAVAAAVATLSLAWPAAAIDRVASMVDEDLAYDVSFLWFDRLAAANIRLERGAADGTYVASLDARTIGLTAFFTRNRRSRYETTMELADGRFRPLRHEISGSRGSGKTIKLRRKIYEFDYARREIRIRKTKTGIPDYEEVRPMPAAGVFDILSTFYNLRAGFIGPLTPGVEYAIPTMVSGEDRSIAVRVLDAAERASHEDFPAGGKLCRVAVDGEIFGSEDGTVFVWFDDTGRPGRTVVENVEGLGDVTGTLKGLGVDTAAARGAAQRERAGAR